MIHRLFLLVFSLGFASQVLAHPLLQQRISLKTKKDVVQMTVQVSLKEILIVQPTAVEAEVLNDAAKLEAASRLHAEYVRNHFSLQINGRALTGNFIKLQPPQKNLGAEETQYLYEFEYPRGDSSAAKLTLSHDMLKEFPYAAGEPWDVSYVVVIKGADGIEYNGFLPPNKSVDYPVGGTDGAATMFWRNIREHLSHGIMHILTGYDHLLFVSALLLAARSFREVFNVVLVFTVAHTLTLILSVLGIVRLPSSIVEPIIAGSIVFVAVENCITPARAGGRWRLLVAFGFGLIHGLGYAGGLVDAMSELPGLATGIAIVAFSVGVELGHLTLIIPLYALLCFLRKKLQPAWCAGILRWGSVLIAMAGIYYFINAVRGE